MELTFKILAVILGGVAAYFLWQGFPADYIFAAAVFAAVSFFISMRFQIKERLKGYEAERLEEEEKRRREEEEFEEEFEEDEPEVDSETPRLNEIPAREQIDDERRTTNDERTI